ncbi:biosynthetic peptidoglycan transglycosylase [Nannocystis bainbridge]|uniref:Transglycosylase domain-containing protein n=1 Tax=Nannocystis bainbridge TaxID=2995303 RepID=A0ABT5E2Z7_9BACT|nr:biosynthetic peptidoglycan transglycosylase [Nannocystis bainbridge]MDC0719803.1 transglycosylase domain-containing protein [Nannocystis bainbridge]
MTTPEPTKSPRPRWRRVALIGGSLGVLLLGGLAVAVATFPRWGDEWVQEQAHARLQRIAGVPVTIARLDLVDFDSVVVEGVELKFGPEASLVIDRIEVGLERDKLWSGQIVVDRVKAFGGRLTGDGGTLREYARDLRARLSQRREDGEGRVKLVPPKASLERLQIDLQDEFGGRSLTLRGVAAIEARLAERTASLELAGVEAAVDERTLRAVALTTRLDLSQGTAGAFPLTLTVDRAATAITPQIAVAEIRGTVTLADASVSRVALDLAGGFSDEVTGDEEHDAAAPLWALEGDVARDLSDGTINLDMEAFKLGRVPDVLARLPVIESESATVGGDLKVAFAEGKANVVGDLEIAGLNVDHPLLARQPVRGLGFSLGLKADVDPRERVVKIEQATLQRGPVKLTLAGEFVHADDPAARHYRADLTMPKVRCQEFLGAIPAELIPSLQGFELKGDFEFEINADVDFRDLEALVLTAKLKPETCKPVKVPPLVSATRLNGPLVHRVAMRDGTERSVDVSEGSTDYTPLDQISPYVLAAVTTTEDGGFWRHKGFITSQFRAALRSNLEAGRVRLGASTITMQMVKNVLLSHERTLSRKMQEVFLTWYVEQSLTKNRIMELYLNVIEFGPGVYGITRAASHYFAKAPLDLTPPEAAYLALMLPSPVRRHVHYCEGAPSPAFQAKLKRLLAIMHGRGRLDPETFEQWKDEGVTFDATELTSKRECMAEVDRLLAASAQQRSLTGLLDDGQDIVDLSLDAEPLADATGGKPKPRGPRAGFEEATLEVIGGLDEGEPARPVRRQP